MASNFKILHAFKEGVSEKEQHQLLNILELQKNDLDNKRKHTFAFILINYFRKLSERISGVEDKISSYDIKQRQETDIRLHRYREKRSELENARNMMRVFYSISFCKFF